MLVFLLALGLGRIFDMETHFESEPQQEKTPTPRPASQPLAKNDGRSASSAQPVDMDFEHEPSVQDIVDNAKEKLTDLKLHLLEVKWLVKNLDEVSKPPLEDNDVSSAQLDVEPAPPIDTFMANSLVGSQQLLATPSIDSSNEADSISKRPRKWWCLRRNKPRELSDVSKQGISGRKNDKKKRKSKLGAAVGKSGVLTESEHKLELLDQCKSENNHHQQVGATNSSTAITLMDEILKEIPQLN